MRDGSGWQRGGSNTHLGASTLDASSMPFGDETIFSAETLALSLFTLHFFTVVPALPAASFHAAGFPRSLASLVWANFTR
jgi:hypothetical protein